MTTPTPDQMREAMTDAPNAITIEQMYAFLREHYLHSRFGARDGAAWGESYSMNLAEDALAHLIQYGIGFISPYEAASGRVIKYDIDLRILNPDAPREQFGARPGNLTHIYGQSM